MGETAQRNHSIDYTTDEMMNKFKKEFESNQIHGDVH